MKYVIAGDYEMFRRWCKDQGEEPVKTAYYVDRLSHLKGVDWHRHALILGYGAEASPLLQSTEVGHLVCSNVVHTLWPTHEK